MIKLVISAERGTSEAGIVFLHTARKYRFECMRFESIGLSVCVGSLNHIVFKV